MMQPLAKFGYGLCGVILLGLSAILFVLTLFRETPLFWLNEGGYPIWLRAFVLHLYYPAFGVVVAAICAFAALSLQLAWQKRYGDAILCAIAVLPASVVIFISIGLLLANNIINLMQGLPLNHH